jgi:hypothetical protein
MDVGVVRLLDVGARRRHRHDLPPITIPRQLTSGEARKGSLRPGHLAGPGPYRRRGRRHLPGDGRGPGGPRRAARRQAFSRQPGRVHRHLFGDPTPGARGIGATRTPLAPLDRRAAAAVQMVRVRLRHCRGRCGGRRRWQHFFASEHLQPANGHPGPGHRSDARRLAGGDPDRYRHLGAQIPPLRHRHRYQPNHRVRPAGGADHRSLCGHRGRRRLADPHRRWWQPRALNRGDGTGCSRLSAAAGAASAPRQPGGLRQTGHPLRGALSLQRGRRRDLRRGGGAGPDGATPG